MAVARKTTKKKTTPVADLAGEMPLHRTLPQDIDAESGLLGSLLIDAGRVMDLCTMKGIVPEAFVDPMHRSIYIAIDRLASRGLPVDGITVANFLTSTDELDKIGGRKTLRALVDRTPSSANAGFYADLVMEQYMRRAILGTVRTIEEAVFDTTKSSEYVLGAAEQAILGISEGRSRLGATPNWSNSVNETMSMLRRQLESPGQLSGLSTGFTKLDDQLRGMHKGEMIVLAARPSMGKTSLAMNIAECVARGRDIMGRPMKSESGQLQKHGVLVFSLEMPQVQLTTRMLCGMAGVSARDVERGQFIKKDVVLPLLQTAAKELAETPIRCDDQGGLDVMELRARARHMHKKEPIELIVIDYLQLLSYREYAAQGQQVMVSKISGELKAMAKELNVPVLVLSQLNRSNEQRGGDERPKNSDLRDSGAIEQDADVIMLLRRPCFMSSRVPEHDDKFLAIVDVSKNRNGATGEVRLNFNGPITRFANRIETNPDMITGDMVQEDPPPTP
jgi:replicative DNA helicase